MARKVLRSVWLTPLILNLKPKWKDRFSERSKLGKRWQFRLVSKNMRRTNKELKKGSVVFQTSQGVALRAALLEGELSSGPHCSQPAAGVLNHLLTFRASRNAVDMVRLVDSIWRAGSLGFCWARIGHPRFFHTLLSLAVGKILGQVVCPCFFKYVS